MAPLSARTKSPSVRMGDAPKRWASSSSFGAQCSSSLWYRLTSYGTWSSSWVEGIEELQRGEQQPRGKDGPKARVSAESGRYQGGEQSEPWWGKRRAMRASVRPYDNHNGQRRGAAAYDQLMTMPIISPADHSVMLIALYILCFTYFPWPGATATWTRSTERNQGIDEFLEIAKPGAECESRGHHAHLVPSRWPTRPFNGHSRQCCKQSSRTSSRAMVRAVS